jgi:tetratricopeptide (TPR) repeat protein
MDRREEALDAIQESVEIYRKLAMENPVEFNSDLARSLHDLSICMSDMGHRDEALDTNQEAVEIRRKLAVEQPDKYNPDLAFSLNNLAIWLSDLGRQDEALDVIQQAVDIRRKLAIKCPANSTRISPTLFTPSPIACLPRTVKTRL